MVFCFVKNFPLLAFGMSTSKFEQCQVSPAGDRIKAGTFFFPAQLFGAAINTSSVDNRNLLKNNFLKQSLVWMSPSFTPIRGTWHMSSQQLTRP